MRIGSLNLFEIDKFSNFASINNEFPKKKKNMNKSH